MVIPVIFALFSNSCFFPNLSESQNFRILLNLQKTHFLWFLDFLNWTTPNSEALSVCKCPNHAVSSTKNHFANLTIHVLKPFISYIKPQDDGIFQYSRWDKSYNSFCFSWFFSISQLELYVDNLKMILSIIDIFFRTPTALLTMIWGDGRWISSIFLMIFFPRFFSPLKNFFQQFQSTTNLFLTSLSIRKNFFEN